MQESVIAPVLVCLTNDIDGAIELDKKCNPEHVGVYSLKVLGIDPGWGSSPFGIVLLQVTDGMIKFYMLRV
jgi:hypothetical protein